MRNTSLIGGGIFTFVIGAILSFAVTAEINALDLTFVGYILMVAGAIMFVLGLVFTMTSRKSRTEIHKSPETGSEIRETEF